MSATEVDRQNVYVGDTIKHVSDEYSTDTRERVAEHVLEYWPRGAGIREIGREADASEATVRDVLNEYFRPLRDGENSGDQEVVGLDEEWPGAVEPPEDEMDEVEVEEQFESRVATLADWFGVSEQKARTLATAEREADFEFSGDERIQGGEPEPEPEPEPAEAPEQYARASHEMPDVQDAPTTEGEMAAYRLGFQDGFTTAWQLNE